MALLTRSMGHCGRLGLRGFSSQVPKVVDHQQVYPMVYGSVEETVMSPYKGGPVYLWLRSSIIWTRRVLGRHWIRWLERNWDFEKMCMQGMPEMHIDPTKKPLAVLHRHQLLWRHA